MKEKEFQKFCYHGHHENIEKWRKQEALKRTMEKRPDLLQKMDLSGEERQILEDFNISEKEEKNGYFKIN